MAIRPKKQALAIIISAARSGIGLVSVARAGIETFKRGGRELCERGVYRGLALIRLPAPSPAKREKGYELEMFRP